MIIINNIIITNIIKLIILLNYIIISIDIVKNRLDWVQEGVNWTLKIFTKLKS